jgi:hypothetical protein
MKIFANIYLFLTEPSSEKKILEVDDQLNWNILFFGLLSKLGNSPSKINRTVLVITHEEAPDPQKTPPTAL